jgi:DNA-binding transcriptional regulator GbsR (MarR family)
VPPAELLVPAPKRAPHRLSPVEVEVIDFFVQFSRLLGFPKSVAEIYGLLFISRRPLAMDDLMAILRLSKGSASQGLRVLRALRAARQVYVPGERRDHYEAETEVRALLAGFLKEQLAPQLDQGLLRLDRIQAMVKQLPPAERDELGQRIEKLRSWERAGKRLVPWVTRGLKRGR